VLATARPDSGRVIEHFDGPGDPSSGHTTIRDGDLIESARGLRDIPIGRQRLTRDVGQANAIKAIMAHHCNRVAQALLEHAAQPIRGANWQVSQRLAVRKSY
jgi:hypothetical protein